MVKKEIKKYEGAGGLVNLEVTAQELLERKRKIQEIQAKVMRERIDYGIVPGCSKPTLLKAGAETLTVTFRLRPVINPDTDIKIIELSNEHKEYVVTIHILNDAGMEIATGVGSCSTMEGKYRYRKGEQVCPECGKKTIKKGSKQYGGGWYCDKRAGGCGAKFSEGDPEIENFDMGRIEHDNPADYYNTCLKMAKKRALIDGVLSATGASHIFTQDIEEMEKEILEDAEYIEVETEQEEKQEQKEEKQEERQERRQEKIEKKTWKDGVYMKGKCNKCGKVNVWIHEQQGDCYACRH